jgi:hypothetical protein
VQTNLKTSVSRLETQLSTLQAELAIARTDREAATQHAQQLETSAAHSRTEFDALRQQNEVLDERARDAESRVRMLLDQFENSVDNYRRQSQIPVGAAAAGINGGHHRAGHDSVSGDSIYTDDDNDGDSTPDASASNATRNSMALDNLASELDALRSHWETTNKAYRLSDRFDFERTPVSEKNELSESLAAWRKRMDIEDEEMERGGKTGDAMSATSSTENEHPQAANGSTASVGSAITAGVGPGGSAMI